MFEIANQLKKLDRWLSVKNAHRIPTLRMVYSNNMFCLTRTHMTQYSGKFFHYPISLGRERINLDLCVNKNIHMGVRPCRTNSAHTPPNSAQSMDPIMDVTKQYTQFACTKKEYIEYSGRRGRYDMLFFSLALIYFYLIYARVCWWPGHSGCLLLSWLPLVVNFASVHMLIYHQYVIEHLSLFTHWNCEINLNR